MILTPNYNLKKIQLDDSPPDITVQDGNWDIIDEQLKNAADHEDDTTIHVTATDKSNWNSKAAGSHTHSASNITSGTLPVTRGGTGQTQLWTSITFRKSNSKFGSFWGSIQYYRYLDMVYFNMGISVTSGVASGSATVGTVSTTYKPAVRTQLASSLSQGHAYIDTDGKLKLYSAMSLDSGTTVYFTGWYYAGD